MMSNVWDLCSSESVLRFLAQGVLEVTFLDRVLELPGALFFIEFQILFKSPEGFSSINCWT